MHHFCEEQKSAVEAVWGWFSGEVRQHPPVMRMNTQIEIMHGVVKCNGGWWVFSIAKATLYDFQKKRDYLSSYDTLWLWTLVGKAPQLWVLVVDVAM